MFELDLARLQRLRRAADTAREVHYAPYSGVLVLAAAETVDGVIAGGSNVETANFTLTKHAEEVAILRALADSPSPAGPGRLTCVYVAGPMPCGSCRQFALEFGSPDAIWVIEAVDQQELADHALTDLSPDRDRIVMKFADALPAAFALAPPVL